MSAGAHRYPTTSQLLADATAATGLDDFGPGDFRDGLDVLLGSLEAETDLDPTADAGVVDDFRRRLVNRLRVEEWYAGHPEIEGLPVRGPIDINGLPRTGTTALANMMSLDPQFRCLRGWEQGEPVPPPVAGVLDDERRLSTQRRFDARSDEEKAAHLYEVDASMEDTEILGMAFHAQGYTLPTYSYHSWWRGADLGPTYAYHRRVTALLQSQCPPDLWLFKAPHHMFHLEAIAEAYPDVRFVMTHRDPAKAVVSYASLVSTIFPPAAGGRDLHRLGSQVSRHLCEGMRNTVDARARLGEDRFFDVHHHDLVADPIGTIRRVYAHLDLEVTQQFVDDVRDWHERNRMGSAGTHRYSAADFGLSEATLRDEFDFYIRRFDVAVKA